MIWLPVRNASSECSLFSGSPKLSEMGAFVLTENAAMLLEAFAAIYNEGDGFLVGVAANRGILAKSSTQGGVT